MSGDPDDPRARVAARGGPPQPSAGLCERCRQARISESARGSRFYQCQPSRTDAGYPRYPRLPVLACTGFEEVE